MNSLSNTYSHLRSRQCRSPRGTSLVHRKYRRSCMHTLQQASFGGQHRLAVCIRIKGHACLRFTLFSNIQHALLIEYISTPLQSPKASHIACFVGMIGVSKHSSASLSLSLSLYTHTHTHTHTSMYMTFGLCICICICICVYICICKCKCTCICLRICEYMNI